MRVETRGKDTRANMIERFKSSVAVYPGALFTLTQEDLDKAKASEALRYVPGQDWSSPDEDAAIIAPERAEADAGEPGSSEDTGNEFAEAAD